jgi:hypothetical protein
MSPFTRFLAVLVLAAGMPASALGGWGFSYHHDHGHHHHGHHHGHHGHYYGHGPYHGHYGHVHHYHYAPVVPYYHPPHWHAPRTSIFLGF